MNNYFNNGNNGYPQYPSQQMDSHSIEYLNLLSKYNNSEKEANYYKNEYSALVNKIKSTFPALLSNNYNLQQLGSKGIDLSDVYVLIDFSVKDITDSKKTLLEMLQGTQNKIATVQNMLNDKNQTIQEQERIIEEKTLQIKALEEELAKLKSGVFVNNTSNISEKFAQSIKPEPTVINEKTLVLSADSKAQEQKSATPIKSFAPEPLQHIKPTYTHEKKQISREEFKERNKNKQAGLNKKPYNPPTLSSFQGTSVSFASVTGGTSIKAVRSDEERNADEANINNSRPEINFDPDIIISSFNDTQKLIIEIIGKTGASTTAELEEHSKKDSSSLSRIIKDLNAFNILYVESIDSGVARKKNIFKFTEFGADIFRRLYNSDPCEANCEKIRKQHDNYVHGYTIMSVAQSFKERFNAQGLTTDRNTLTFKLPDGKTYIPDIAFVQNGQQYYVEVELGNTPEEAFFDKCNKMKQVTKTLFFVSNTKDNLNIVRTSVDKWIHKCLGGKEELAGYTIKYASSTDLSRGKITDTIKF